VPGIPSSARRDEGYGLCLYPRMPHPEEPKATVVLLIEDFADARDLYSDYLRHVGLEVVTADNAIDGIRAARDRQPDVIVMDAGLPGMSGWDATAALKSDPTTAGICVIMLTGHVFAEAEQQAAAAGVNVFLRKPCLPDVLHREILSALEQCTTPTGKMKRPRPSRS
jgi:two-component system cell cycle response regulator DivK